MIFLIEYDRLPAVLFQGENSPMLAEGMRRRHGSTSSLI